MKQDNKYTEIMKQLNYKPIGSVLLRLCGVVKSLKVKDLMTFEDYKNNLFIKSDGVYQPKKTKLFRWYSEKQLKKMYKDKPL
jgi:hypothetical protein